jgi:arginine/serine-rich splicing factor 12
LCSSFKVGGEFCSFIVILILIFHFSGQIPDEYRALEMAANGTLVPGIGTFSAESRLPPEVVSRTEGYIPNQVIRTYDPKLEDNNLPEYPALPVNYDDKKIEETRRTILVLNPESDWRLEDLIDYFKRAGEVKYARFAETDNRQRIALVEFCEQRSVIHALKLQGSYYSGVHLNLHHSTQPIVKPEAKTNEAAQKEIEEAMSIVKECHNQISAVIDPAFGLLATKEKGSSSSRRHSRTRSRTRSRSKTSHTRSKRSRSRRR